MNNWVNLGLLESLAIYIALSCHPGYTNILFKHIYSYLSIFGGNLGIYDQGLKVLISNDKYKNVHIKFD